MKDEIVSYEVAKLAKEKGFDEFCDTSYTHYLKDGGGEFHDTQYKKGDVHFNKRGILRGNNSHHDKYESDFYEICSAPTQSLLQRWLREIHKAHIELNAQGSWTYTLSFRYIDGNGKHWVHTHKEDGVYVYFKTYEEALEKGLEISLNLIEL